MDVVLALTIEWYDKRLVWGLYDYTKEYAIPIKTIEVSSNHIWTPRNAIFNNSTLTTLGSVKKVFDFFFELCS